MTKRLLTVFVAFFVFLSSFCITASAKDDSKICGVNVNLPDVYCEIKGSCDKSDIDEVNLDGEKLTVNEVYKAKDVDSKAVYVLVDVSGSMKQKSIDVLKKDLISYANSFGSNDKFVLLTFGSEIKTVLKGGESGSKVREKINGLKSSNKNNTSFYDAIDEAYSMSLGDKNYKRKYAIMISDGADRPDSDKKGQNSESEVKNEVKTHKLPIYGMCVDSSNTEKINAFGDISRISGGSLETYSPKNASKKFSRLKKTINDVTILEMNSKNKKSKNGDSSLSVTANGETVKCESVRIEAAEDNTAPYVKSITYDKDSNSFVIEFSEEVDNADKKASFESIKTKGGTDIGFSQPKYSDRKATLKADKPVYNGEYTFKFKNDIVDSTDNKNELKDKEKTQTIDNARPIIIKILIIAGIALIPILFLLAIYLILLNIKKKKNVEKIKDIFVEQVQVEEREVEHVVIQQPKGKLIKVSIDAGNGQYHTVDYNLISSMIVGRSDMCDLRVDDMRMSKQHFVLELTDDGRLAVTDLETTNGTYVNGVRIQSRTLIQSGTKVMAGNSVIAFYLY